MNTAILRKRLKPALLACAAGIALSAAPAAAQQVDSNKLLEIMVAKGLVTRAEADQMIAEARTAPVAAAAVPIEGGTSADGTQTIPYVPQVVRDQITEQVRAQLASQAQAEGWSKPGETPEWTRRITLYGDVRVRGEGRFYDKGNADIFPNYYAVNAGSPQNINALVPGFIGPEFLNTTQNRQRAQLRARLGVKVRVTDWISANIRLATGNNISPVSTNETLGAFGGGGYQIWLDQASIRLKPTKGVDVDLGRFGNPFFTTDLMFDPDMNFDGVALSVKQPVGETLSLFGAAGAFPVFNTSLNFGSRNAPVAPTSGTDPYPGVRGAYKSQDRYLLAAQLGVDFHPVDKVSIKLAGGYFHYDKVVGQVSAPCYWYELTCSTDARRPAFQQFGNTLMVLRNVVRDPSNPAFSVENQYFGLASKFRILNAHISADYMPSDHFGVRFEGEYAKNLGFDRAAVVARAINNLGAAVTVPAPTETDANATKTTYPYLGGDAGWQARLTLGSALDLNPDRDWNVKKGGYNFVLGYRRIESDAVIDAFADSDFGLGGTNFKGWFIGGNYAIGKNTMFGARWVNADEVAGAPLSVDRLFVDLVTRF
ncbi:MAG: putative porin [Sphingobium sp.]|uniref:putative porin n=1 Tax=Sphingobium sp. CECT 9361 TaxID=2845384 RepID=UPI001E40F628|nr:putative porin [Sphingobium sp. CECT 9361]CAH0348268.1 hypothetical protein SPH9361_00014 [Sphingobium sp. CECT 9361]